MHAKRNAHIPMWAASLFVGAGLAHGVSASTLAQTQLKGLAGVNVAVNIGGDVGQNPQELRALVKARVEKYLNDAGLALVSKSGETLRVEIEGVRAACSGGGESISVRVSVQLIERVALKRDPSREVPGGGAVTWWRDGVRSGSPSDITKAIENTLDYFVGALADEWRIENSAR